MPIHHASCRFRSVAKRKFKDKKFGFGGKKRGLKSNTKDSVNDVTGFKPGFKNRGPDSGIVKRSVGAHSGASAQYGSKWVAPLSLSKENRQPLASALGDWAHFCQ